VRTHSRPIEKTPTVTTPAQTTTVDDHGGRSRGGSGGGHGGHGGDD
jgi:hypothetical protein